MADIQDLLDELKNITTALQSQKPAAGQAQPPQRQALQQRTGEDFSKAIERENKLLSEKLDLLESELEFRGRLTEAQELERLQLEERARVLEQIEGATDPADRDRLLKHYDNLTKSQTNLNKATEVGRGKFEALSRSMLGVTGTADKLASILPTTSAEMAEFATRAKEMAESGELFERIGNKLIAEGFNLSDSLDKANAQISRRTGLFQETGTIMDEQAKSIRAVERDNVQLGITTADVARAYLTLQTSMADFTRLSKPQRDAILDSATEMEALGVSGGTVASIFDKATKSLGYSAGEVSGLAEELHATSQSLGVPFQQVAEGFEQAADQLSVYGDQAIVIFQELSKQSKATGLSMQSLLKIGGEAFDTFDGAAKKVGRLNAILGGPYLNSIDMLNASEADRIDLIKQSMDASGQMFNDLNKFEQLAIADALGVSREEARRLFGELDAAEEMSIRKKEKMAETAQKAQDTIAKLTNAFNKLVIALDFVIGPVSWLIGGFADLISTPVGKWIARTVVYGLGLFGMFKKLSFITNKVSKGLLRSGGLTRLLGRRMQTSNTHLQKAGKLLDKVGKRMQRFGARMQRVGTSIRKFSPWKFMTKQLSNLGGLARTVGKQLWRPFAWLGGKLIGTGGGGLFGAIGSAGSWLWGVLTTGASGMAAAVLATIGNITGAVMGFWDVWKDGQGIINAVGGAIMGIPRLFGQIMEKIPFVNKLLSSEMGASRTFDYIFKLGDYKPKPVNDSVILKDGQVIEPAKQDAIITAKPGGAISGMLGALFGALGMPSLFAAPAAAAAAGAAPAAAGQTEVKFDKDSFVVYLGDKQLTDIFVEVLKSPELSSAISGFGNK